MANVGYGYNENCIEWIRDEERSTVSLSQRRVINKVEQYAESHPAECEIVARNEDGSICAHVPVSWIKISPPRKLTEEQRKEIGQRLNKNNLNMHNTVDN